MIFVYHYRRLSYSIFKHREGNSVKKVLSILVIITLLMPIVGNVAMADTVSSIYSNTEIEDLVRSRLSIDKTMELSYSNLYTQDLRLKKLWNLEFSNETASIYVNADAESGEIIHYNKWRKDYNQKPMAILEDTAKKNAIDFIRSLEPEKFKETEEVATEGPSMIIYELKRGYYPSDNYYFLFVRKIAGEFFPNNYFKVQVSGVTGEVVQYEMAWDEAVYENNQALISHEEARRIFEGEDRFQIKYVALASNNKDKEKTPVLTPVYVYIPKDADVISAIDGRLFKREELYQQWPDYRPLYDAGGKVESEIAKEIAVYSQAEVIPEEGVLSKEKIEGIVFEALGKEVDLRGFKVQNSNYSSYYLGSKGKYWSIYWCDDEKNKSLHAMVNAETGDILSVDFYQLLDQEVLRDGGVFFEKDIVGDSAATKTNGEKVDANNIIDFDEAKVRDQIMKKIQRIFPHIQEKEIKFERADMPQKSLVNMVSPRYIDNIPYEGNKLNVIYNHNTEEIVGLYYQWHEVEAQPASKIIDKKKIEKEFYNKVGFERYLTQMKDQVAAKKDGLDIPLRQLVPVYGLKSFDFAYVDGITGKFLMYNGEEYVEEGISKGEFKDIKNHPYQQQIILMKKMGILKEESDLFRPNDALHRKDAIKWIVELGWSRSFYSLDGYYEYYRKEKDRFFKDIDVEDPYYPYIVAAVKNGILQDQQEYFYPEKEVTKLEATKWILKAMKQGNLAEFTEIFKNPYTDTEKIHQKDIGYIALAKYYNIYDDGGLGGDFKPEKILTRGDMVKVLYNLLNHDQK